MISIFKTTLFLYLPLITLCLLSSGCRKADETRNEDTVVKTDTIQAERSKEDYNEAIKNYRQLLKKEPDNIILLSALGNSLFDVGRDSEAIKVYKKTLKIYPDNVAVRTDLGTAYRRIGLPDKALAEYRKSLSIDPRHSISRYNIGVVLLWDKKNIAKAIKIWEELLRIDPYFVLAEELRGNIKILKEMLKTRKTKK
jgi:tetratricopeptide (TPR) repeat protein